MKKIILFLLIFSAATAKAQTLKDLLYDNKLKKDSSGVIRKTDDLKSKIDTAQKKSEPEKQKPIATVNSNTDKGTPVYNSTTTTADASNATTTVAVTTPNAPAKSNTKIWKEYTDALAISLKNEFLSSKKIKKETYYFTVDYEIATDGTVSIPQIILTPENGFLLSHVQQKIWDGPPQLAPVFNSAGKPQKIKRKHNFYITKE